MIKRSLLAAVLAFPTQATSVVSGSALVSSAFLGSAWAQGTNVNVMDYALSHPSDNAQISPPPQLGDSVPRSVTLQRPDDGNSRYGYFYYAGKPVIVDMKTRAVVRVGN